MSGPIVHKGNERSRACPPWNQLVQNVANEFDDVEITSFAVAAEIVFLSRLPLRQQTYESIGVIIDVQPVTYVGTAAVYWQRFALDSVQDGQWNEFLWKLVRTVIVRAIRDDDWQVVCLEPGMREMVGSSLAGRIR